MRRIIIAIVVCVSVSVGAVSSYAVTIKELSERITACDKALEEITKTGKSIVPKEVFQRCKGIAIFPNVLKAGVVLGVSLGQGVALKRNERDGTWSKPAFFSIRGGSIGVQAGAQYSDLVLLFMKETGVEGLLEQRYTIGADIGISAGKMGGKASKSSTVRSNSDILSYSRSSGVFAGVSLKGSALEPDVEANKLFHGKGVSVQDIFYEGAGRSSKEAESLIRALSELSK